ncbi:kinesin [Natronorubrum sp. JWXQ-INN-674]|uniref:Kinesin n=1 Tax=Natronorubrum halalkaliphilum TaxID=2691917 RepID=A0A6B0VLZ8_9EURY|nr:kinesin [Natronorubrum halalkaliphilum]MXV62107.1 kinesin [Natronorubrum halalkaliphilum]
MSKSTTPNAEDPSDELTDDERELFERLANRYDDEVGRIFEIALQSSTDSEEANS